MIEGRPRRDAKLVADLADCRRHAVTGGEGPHEIQHIALTRGELSQSSLPPCGHITQPVLRRQENSGGDRSRPSNQLLAGGGGQAGSQGSQTGQVSNPWSRASETCLKYTRSTSVIRGTQAHSRRWNRRAPRCATNGSPCSSAVASVASAGTAA